MRLLLTGFEPFGGGSVNPSERAVRALAHEKMPRAQLRTAILPVDRAQGPAALVRAMNRYRPEAVLCLGQSSSRRAISIERVAINLMDYCMADNSGSQVTDEPVAPDGPAAYFVTLPVRAMLEAVKAANVPALPEQAATAERLMPSMSLETLLAGIRAAIAAIAAIAPHHRRNKSE